MRGKTYLRKTIAFAAGLLTILTVFSSGVYGVGNEKYNMSYLYFGKPVSYISYVDKTRDSLDTISPSYFDLNEDGSLKLTPVIDLHLIEEMHKRGVKVTPFLSNHWDRAKGAKALENRVRLAEAVAEAIKTYNLDGVNVDIENMTEVHRSQYSDFVRLLREKMPAGRTLSVAVAPNPMNATRGWQGSYDYSALAKNSDYLMIMAYDEHYQGGPEGPVASGAFVEKSIKYALAKAPAEKLVLGIPFYGRFWKQGAASGGYGISAVTVEKLIRDYTSRVLFDPVTKSPKAEITIKAGDVKPTVLGSQWQAGKYVVWYENQESIKYKLRLVQKYNLKGTGSWSLGQEASGTWNYYSMWLNGRYFSDVEGHYAQQAILSVESRGWMLGVSSTKFQPNSPLTRAQAVAIIVRALRLQAAGPEVTFADTANHYARKEIGIARQHNIIAGVGGNRFAPDLPVTREQMAIILDNALPLRDVPEGTQVGFPDVSQGRASYEPIRRMSYNGLITGYPDGRYHPFDRITRAQMAVIMDRGVGFFTDAGPVVASR